MQNETSASKTEIEAKTNALTRRLNSNVRFEDAAACVEAALNNLRQTEDVLARQLADLQIYISRNTQLTQTH